MTVAPEVVKKRPAETAGAAGAVALLAGRLLGITDPDTLVALGIAIGFAPAAITWLVTLIRGPSTG